MSDSVVAHHLREGVSLRLLGSRAPRFCGELPLAHAPHQRTLHTAH